MIKVLIVDDQQLLLDLLSHMLSNAEDIDVVATGRDGNQAVALVEKHLPDVILMDIQMPKCDGIEATKRIKAHHPKIKILILSSSSDDMDVHKALSNGADGYILKTIREDELTAVIKSAYANIEVIHEDVKEAAFRSKMGEFADEDGKTVIIEGVKVKLSERDLEIIKMIIEGKSTKEMAETLFVSEGRLRNIITELIQKMMCENRTQLVVFAMQNGLVD
ncbi:response regulator transcription factor [bacterium]|nr:response regulator transcription factor [bacterium]